MTRIQINFRENNVTKQELLISSVMIIVGSIMYRPLFLLVSDLV